MNDGSCSASFTAGSPSLGLLVGGLVIVGYYKDQFREWKD